VTFNKPSAEGRWLILSGDIRTVECGLRCSCVRGRCMRHELACSMNGSRLRDRLGLALLW